MTIIHPSIHFLVHIQDVAAAALSRYAQVSAAISSSSSGGTQRTLGGSQVPEPPQLAHFNVEVNGSTLKGA